MLQINKVREKYLKDGFVVIKSFFKKEHIQALRPKMIEFAETHKKKDNEILLNENVRELLLNKDLFRIIREILNSKNILYFSDSSVVNHQNPFESTNGFHHDARGEDLETPYDDEYPVIRLGIYFENYKDFSGGLKIKRKSHKYFCFNFRRIFGSLNNLFKILFTKKRYKLSSLILAKSLNLDLEEGDIVIWNLKTHHCGTSRRLKLFPNYCLQPNLEKLLPSFFYLPTQYSKNRCSIFATYAKNDLSNKNLLGYLKIKTHKERQKQIASDSQLINRLNEIGCKLSIPSYLN